MGAAVAAVSSVATAIGSLGGSSTAAAKTGVDSIKAQILAAPGSANAKFLILRLRCLSGDESAVAAWNAASGDHVAVGGCGFGTQEGRDYAKAALDSIQAQIPGVNVSTVGTSGPAVVPQNVGGGVVAGGVSTTTLLLLAVGAVVLFAILKKS